MYHLSKSTYILALQCTKALYLNRYFPGLRPPLPPERKLRFDKGHQIGQMARTLFPNGIDLSPTGRKPDRKSITNTRHRVKEASHPLFESSFIYDGVVVMNDVLVPSGGAWTLYEVKSSTGVTQVYREDLALQYYILTNNNIRISKAAILYLASPLSELLTKQSVLNIDDFKEEDLTRYCEEQKSDVALRIRRFQLVLAGSTIPDIRTGSQCSQPYPCDFYAYCSKNPGEQEPRDGLFAKQSNGPEE